MSRGRFLPANGPLERDPMLATLGAHAVPGIDVADREAATHTRLLPTSSGAVKTTVTISNDGVYLDAETDDPAQFDELAATTRTWFDLDTDAGTIVDAFGDDPLIGPLVEARPGLRILGHPDGFEAAITTVLGQQVSLAACRTFSGRLVAAYGSPAGADLSVLPAPSVIATAPVEELRAAVGITNARAATVHAVAAAFDDGLRIGPSSDADDARRRLLALPGIGPWTVDYLSLRAIGDRNAFPSGDLVLRRALGGVSAKEAARAGEAWHPLRAYAVMHLWTANAYLLP